MKLAIVHDRDGRIVAAANLDADEADGPIPRPIPINAEQTAIELVVPEEHRAGELADVCLRLRVDPKRKQLVLRERA